MYPEFAATYTLLRKRGGSRRKSKTTDAETGEISVNVFNSATNEPIVNATLTIADFNIVEQTDEDGNFIFEGLAASVYRIGCTAPGFDVPAVQTVNLAAGESIDVDFILNPVQPPIVNVAT